MCIEVDSISLSINSKIQMTLLAAWLNSQLVGKLYPATLAGIKYTCEQFGSGISFEVILNAVQYITNDQTVQRESDECCGKKCSEKWFLVDLSFPGSKLCQSEI